MISVIYHNKKFNAQNKVLEWLPNINMGSL